ncbi:hypothetical protein SAMN04515647_3742 [Cohaesibacter sp. ES.047]|uniref:hypothetical protein n=1 Tax=Cohaesibacter sp. ES.047 TaxID=1798205 RepID=UPI000BC04EE8|nr:hypothetical protein [Cohaesibacter sp. ES.047]SNY93448.1 hypothetical protein SAMN04515647_3742 [Cohaesibacter sp. ES.047]
MQRWIILVLMAQMALLTACAGRVTSDGPRPGSSGPAALPVPRLKTYEKAFVDRLADELEAMPIDSASRVCAADLYTLRRQICAINGQQPACQLMRQSK